MGVTIKDVAKAAGVSISTVSKVINGHYSISEETQERVQQVIQELNFYPSASAQNFAKGATRTVVVLTDLGPNTTFSNPHMFEIIAGMEETLRTRNYRLVLSGSQPSAACERAEECISRRSADALAVHVSIMTHQLSALCAHIFPISCWVSQHLTARYAGSTSTIFPPASLPQTTWPRMDIGELLFWEAGSMIKTLPIGWKGFVKGWRAPDCVWTTSLSGWVILRRQTACGWQRNCYAVSLCLMRWFALITTLLWAASLLSGNKDWRFLNR